MDKFIKFGIIAFLSSFISLQAAEFESNVALSSEYMWRGMTQSDGQAAVSGGFDISGTLSSTHLVRIRCINRRTTSSPIIPYHTRYHETTTTSKYIITERKRSILDEACSGTGERSS